MVHGAVRTFLKSLSALFIVGLVVIVVATWRLSQGPVSIGFLAPYISEALNGIGEDVEFQVSDAIIKWAGFRDRFEIQIVDVTVSDGRQRVVASFPAMTVDLSVRSILDGAPAPEAISVSRPVLRFTRSNDGVVSLGFEPLSPVLRQSDARLADELHDGGTGLNDRTASILVQAVVGALTDPAGTGAGTGYLRRFAVDKATVVFADQQTGAEWVVPSGNINLERDGIDIRLRGELPVLNNDRPSNISVDGIYDVDAQEVRLTLLFSGLRPSSFAPLLPRLPFLSGASVDLTGRLTSTLRVDQSAARIVRADVDIEDGAGSLAFPPPVSKRYDVSGLQIEAQFDQSSGTADIVISNARLGSGTLITGRVSGEGITAAPVVEATVQIDQLALEDLKSFWPADVKPNTGRWIKTNLNGGAVTDAAFDFLLRGQDLGSIDVTDFSGQANLGGIDVTYMRQMPPVLGAAGKIQLTPSEVIIEVDTGRVEQADTTDSLELTEGRIRLHGLDGTSHQADIDVRVIGSVTDAISLIESDPLNYASALGIDPNETYGRAEVALGLKFPLIQDLKLADVSIETQASLGQVAIEQAALGLDLTAGQFTLVLDNEGMDIVGTAALGGIRSGISWRENFTRDEFTRRYAVDAVIENDQRTLVGLDADLFRPPYMDGPVRVEALYTVGEGQADTLFVEADLIAADMRISPINWRKKIGVPALLSAEIDLSDDGPIDVKEFVLDAPEVNTYVSGSVAITDNQLSLINVEDAQLGENRMSVTARRALDGYLEVDVSGPALDGRAFWTSLKDSNRSRGIADQSRVPLRFSAEIDRVLLSDDGEMTNAEAVIVQDAAGIRGINFDARFDGGQFLTFDVATEGDERTFTARSDNGGEVLKSLGLGDDLVSGAFDINGALDKSGAVTGTVNISDFKLVEAPLLARLLSVAALTGIVDELRGTGISFSELNLPFRYSDSVLEIDDGAMYGPSLGLTARGTYDVSNEIINGQGTIIPAYAVNSALGAIPILGPVLTGGEEGGGIFAATFVMRGTPEGGEITVNPLATLTPGFLRQIFRVFEPAPIEPNQTSASQNQVDSTIE